MEAIEHLAARLITVQRTDTVLKNIRPLHKKDDGRFPEWVGDMERYFVLAGIADDRKAQMALLTSTGQMGRFIGTTITETPDITWRELKWRTGDYCKQARRPQETFLELAVVRQGREEGMREYIQRLTNLAEGAYEEEAQAHPIVRTQIKDFFIEGIRDGEVKVAVLRANPETAERAYQLAITESGLRKRINKTEDRWEEPMEICHARRRRTNLQPPDRSFERERRREAEKSRWDQGRRESRHNSHWDRTQGYNERASRNRTELGIQRGNWHGPSERGPTGGLGNAGRR